MNEPNSQDVPPSVIFDEISAEFIEEVGRRLREDQIVKRSLPGGGLLSIDRELPFLCVYRRDPEIEDAGTSSFANHEAAYLSAPGGAPVRKGLAKLIQRIVRQAANRFGAFLILELRSAPDAQVRPVEDAETGEHTPPPPTFRIHVDDDLHCPETVDALRFGLTRIRLQREPAVVDVRHHSKVHPPGLKPLLTTRQKRESHCVTIGLEILPVYRDPDLGNVYPEVLEVLRRKVSKVLKKAFYAFTVQQTSLRPHHYYSLGRRRIPRSVWQIDKRIAAVAAAFDTLLLVTPVNAQSSWMEFEASGFRKHPKFRYRRLPFDPLVRKRELLEVPVERIDDPTLAQILRSTQVELDRQLTLLIDIGSERFRYGGIQIYGSVESELLSQARTILELVPADAEATSATNVGPRAFARRAEREVARYRQRDATFNATVELREDMYSGLLVSGNQLFVGQGVSVSERRVAALLEHEVGTHLVTRHNGRKQPMQLLESGLAGYDPLQEGLAVLAEYLVGGLNPVRLRLLAARVVAADAMIRGAAFSETYSELTEDAGFASRTAYTIVLRVYRGGGLAKDAAYLRGLNQVLAYLNAGGAIEPLYVGKLAPEHIPLVQELLHREVLHPPALLPQCLEAETSAASIQKVRSFSNALDLTRDLLAEQP